MRKLTTEEFIAKARSIHGEKYDYSSVIYTNNRTNVKIICPRHGIFLQTPYKHLLNRGCSKCVGRNRTVEEFIAQCKTRHGGKYDYSHVTHCRTQENINIRCPHHGIFSQMGTLHLQGQGCPKCVGKNKSTNDFICAAKKIHGDKYDYSETIQRFSRLKSLGYDIKYIWEKDWEKWNKSGRISEIPIRIFHPT